MSPMQGDPFSGFKSGGEPDLPSRLGETLAAEMNAQIRAQLPPAPTYPTWGDIFADIRRMHSLTMSDRPILHAIHVTPHPIAPRGWTRMYRTDGRMVVYVDTMLWHSLDIQQWRDIPVAQFPLTGVPVYEEKA